MRASFAVLAIVLGAFGCGRNGAEGDGAGGTTPRVPVGVGVVREDSITSVLRLSGRLTPVRGGSAALTAPVAGTVGGVAVQLGSQVERGEVLMTLDAPELAARTRELAAAAAVARRDAARQGELLAAGIVARKVADQAAAAAIAAETQAEAAQALQAQTRIRSPLRGTVQRVAAQNGEHVEPGALLVEVIRFDTLGMLLSVPAARLPAVKPRQAVDVWVAGDATPHPGIVESIAPGVDTLTNTGQALLRVPNPGRDLRPGTAATAVIRTAILRHALIVPDSALVLVGDRLAVFVIGSDSVAHARIVTVGIREGGRAEVRGPVVPGDRVATTGAYGLQDGMRVVPRDTHP